MKQIPVIDLSAARTGGLRARQSLAQEIDNICREIGFLTIAGHGVPAEVMDTLREKAHAFFALPLHEKCKAIHPVAGTPRGYRAMGGEALAYANDGISPPDLRDFYPLGRASCPDEPYYQSGQGPRYFIPNLWPREPVGLAEAAAAYYAEMEKGISPLMRLAALL